MKARRLALRLDPDTLPAVDEFRRRESDLPTRPEALRRLVSLGLASTLIKSDDRDQDSVAKPRFDKVAYQREYMRKRRAAQRMATMQSA